VYGAIEFFTGEPRRLDAELLEAMSTLGDQIGQVVERRTNHAIADELFVSDRAVERHVTSISTKLDLPAGEKHHRRVLTTPARAPLASRNDSGDANDQDTSDLAAPRARACTAAA
jgi:hypothetical protein